MHKAEMAEITVLCLIEDGDRLLYISGWTRGAGRILCGCG